MAVLGAGPGFGVLQRLLEAPIAAELTAQAAGRSSNPPRFAANAIIRTVLQDIRPDALSSRATLMHEHLGGAFTTPPSPPLSSGASRPPRDDAQYVALLIDELKQTYQEGVGCIVDAVTGPRSEQQFENLKTIAARSGMHIVAAGGYYRAPYPQAVAEMSEEQLAAHLVQNAHVQRWGAFGEIGTSLEMHPDERKMLRAVSRAHLRIGAPIFTHTPHESCPRCALEQLDILESAGVNLRQVCIGHITSIKPDDDPRCDTAKAIAARGAFLGFDTVGHQGLTSLVTESQKVKMLLTVLEAGHADRVLIAADFSQTQLLKANWGSGFSTALTVFVPKLRYAGVSDAIIRTMTVDNPREFLAFVPKAG